MSYGKNVSSMSYGKNVSSMSYKNQSLCLFSHETAERFVIEPTPSPSGEKQDVLVIDRLTQEISSSPGIQSDTVIC